jgi:hypothetical protein
LGLVAVHVLELLIAMSTLAMAVFTSEKPNSQSKSVVGGLVSSRILGCGVNLTYMCKSLDDLRTYCLYTIGLMTSRL